MGKFKTTVLCVSVSLITAAIAGGGVYIWQNHLLQTKSSDYEDTITTLRSNVAAAKSAASPTPTPTPTPATTPPVLYTGDGAAALTATVKTEFTTKLTDPYIDYYAQDGQVPVVSLLITVPTKKGDPYKVMAIRKSGGLYENFSYSKLGSVLDTWKPTCGTTACSFSDAYKAKYPEVVK